MSGFEQEVEQATIAWLQELGYSFAYGAEIAPGGDFAERETFDQVILEGRLLQALTRLNPHLPPETIQLAMRKITRPEVPSLEEANVAFHRMLTRGIEVQVRRNQGTRGDLCHLVDFDHPERNDWLVVNQFTVIEGKHNRRPDVVVFLNGMPIAVIELKDPSNQGATLASAWNQIQTYKAQIPGLFRTNELVVISDGIEAKVGSLTAPLKRFAPWRTVDGTALAPSSLPKLHVLLEGLFERRRMLDFLQHFVLWETNDGFVKKVAGYHQFHAVNKAVRETIRASRPKGDKRIGVVWHTQGSGKSISMALYVGKLIRQREMENPTVVVLTDRNDLDGQLFDQFCAAKDLIPSPVQAENRDHLKELLQVASGGVVFSTIQKFSGAKGERYPMLSDRRNIVVVADEAHRSQYEFIEGFARNVRDALPNASFIGFTGTPIEFDDRSTPAVFGDYIDAYTVSQSVDDEVTVPIFYEARLAKIKLSEEKKPKLDEEFEEVTEGEEDDAKGKLKSKWARLEAMVGTDERLELIARDIVDHWQRRLEALDGKAMIVVMSRRIAVELYGKLVALCPQWHSNSDESGVMKVVMTGAASDPADYQPHVRNKEQRRAIEKRFKDADDPLKLVIVRDMWLTGFDVPCAHTLYVDKPMKGHGLMQAIARVNRVFKDKPSGLVVDYLGLAEQLRRAVGRYGGAERDKPGVPVELALDILFEKVEIVRGQLHGFSYKKFFTGDSTARMDALAGAADHVCKKPDGRKRYLDAMSALKKAVGIAIHLEGARDLRDEVGFFQLVEANLRKYTVGAGGKSDEELDLAIKQIVSEAIASDGVIDIFGAAGLQRPNIAILSDEFLESVKSNPHKNLQLEVLRKLLQDEVHAMVRRNVVQGRKFSEMLEKTLMAYHNRTLQSAEVILELVDMARQIREVPSRGAALGLSDDEMAFYDALVAHGGVKEVMGDTILSAIAHDLVEAIRNSVTIDWTQKEAVRADLRRKVKRLLNKHGYPPDKQAAAVVTVIEQAEVVARDWAEV